MDSVRPYAAAFAARFMLLLQYRAAALAGFATQCWWGGIKVMVYAAFYAAAPAAAGSMSLAQTITYTWLAQALLALVPWGGDPEIGQAVRSGAIGYERLRPIDTYGWWYARAAAWMTARVAPRAALMLVFAGILLPLVGLETWSWRPPPNIAQACLFGASAILLVALSSAWVMLLNLAAVRLLDERGVNALTSSVIIVFSGNLLPLPLFPDWMQGFLFVQPFSGMLDIPVRIYSGDLTGSHALAGLALQAGWTIAFVLLGRVWMGRVMGRLQMQGG